MEEKTQASQHLFVLYGTLAFLGFFSFYFFNTHYIGQEAYENPLIRGIACTLSLFLALSKFWPQPLKKIIPLYWYFTLCFNIPFFFSFMFLKNHGDMTWLAHGLASLIILFLLTDWFSCTVLLFLGVGFGSLAYMITTPDPHIPENLSTFLIIYISMVGHALWASHRNSAAHKERLNSMKVLAGAIAHELRTPLSAISMISQMLRINVPALVTGYKQAKQTDPNLDDADEEYMEQVPDEIDLTTRNAFGIIDMLLMNLKDVSEKTPPESCSMNVCIKNALKSYPMTADERALVHFETPGHDFTFQGNDLFMRHVLFNLLKNALHYVKAANKGAIFIRTEETPKENRVIFKDTGMGMPASMVSHVFDRFYSRTQHGTGIGLAFCKSVLEGIGGKISCESVQGEHTTFILSIPKT